MRNCRKTLLLICFAAMLQAQSQTYSLIAERNDDKLLVAAPQMHVLQGKSLERLQNGASVTYVFELTITADPKSATVTRLRRLFAFSFDLWEERFSVVQVEPQGPTGSHLTASGAEAWCLEHMPLPLPELTPERTFMINLECWEQSGNEDGEGGLSLAGLIDVFSRKSRDAAPRWQAVSGSLRTSDLKGVKQKHR